MGQITQKEYLANVKTGVENELEANMSIVPEGFNRQRFTLNCVAMLTANIKDYNDVNPDSVVGTFMKGAYLGLDFFNGDCYAIAYKGEVKFQTDYKGEIKLCKRYSKNPIKDIYAKNVRKGDFFEERIQDGRQSVDFKPASFSNEPIIGSFAVVLFRDGSMMYDTMSVNEIEEVKKNFSTAQNSKAWLKTPGEMYKKTVLRRLCKMIDLDFDNVQQCEAFDDGSGYDVKGRDSRDSANVVSPTDPFANKKDDIIDVDSRVVGEYVEEIDITQ